MTVADSSRTVVVDTNVLINLCHLDRLDLLAALEGYEFVAPDFVVAEVTMPDHAQKVTAALEQGHLRQEPVVGGEIAIYSELKQVMGKGEAACLAMAEARGGLIASDERRRVLRYADERLGTRKVLNTPGILVLAIRAGAISVEEADQYKAILEKRRFKMKFASFRDIVDPGIEEAPNDRDAGIKRAGPT